MTLDPPESGGQSPSRQTSLHTQDPNSSSPTRSGPDAAASQRPPPRRGDSHGSFGSARTQVTIQWPKAEDGTGPTGQPAIVPAAGGPDPQRQPTADAAATTSSWNNTVSDLVDVSVNDPRAAYGSDTHIDVVPVPTPKGSLDILPAYEGPQGGTVEVLPAYPAGSVETVQASEYRSPEAVIEGFDEPSDSTLPPGVLAEHIGEDDMDAPLLRWSDSDDGMQGAKSKAVTFKDIDEPGQATPLGPAVPERPQIGPGTMAKLWFEQLHKHPTSLWRPDINHLPQPPPPKPPRPLSAPATTAEAAPAPPVESYPKPLTLEDVSQALPGHGEPNWYFCTQCWAWYHIVAGRGTPPVTLQHGSEAWAALTPTQQAEFTSEKHRLADLETSRAVANMTRHHFHPFRGLIQVPHESRIERVDVEGHVDTFIHFNYEVFGGPPEILESYQSQEEGYDEVLYASCSSDAWVFVQGPVPGQIPVGLVHDFTQEKLDNPSPGADGAQSVVDAWSLAITLLSNPLFRGKRGWVKLENKTFQHKIGVSLRASHLMYRLGFLCKEFEDGNRIGPLAAGDVVASEAQVKHMDQYFTRTWVEICLWLQEYQHWHGKDVHAEYVKGVVLGEDLERALNIMGVPEVSVPFSDVFTEPLHILGVSNRDTVGTIEDAYDLQVSEDLKHTGKYLGALEVLSRAPIPGADLLQIKVATERSLDRFSDSDIDKAYEGIGITSQYLDTIHVERDDVPPDHIFDMHRNAMSVLTDAEERATLGHHLYVIGKVLGNEVMMKIGRTGSTYLSLDQAYNEFNLSRTFGTFDSDVDQMLILQYETWISDRPSRADHYRMALSIIANAPGEERPVLQAFLAGKDISELQGPARRDIPAGLRNIGNTCYLNSVLQFLYTIKPIRDAVMSFKDTDPVAAPPSNESAKAREKRIKVQSSRRFVKFLGDLFTQMYKTESSAVVPQEELARLAILPIDLVDQRHDAIPEVKRTSEDLPMIHEGDEVGMDGPGRVTIDNLPMFVSPVASPTSSSAATAAGTEPSTPLSPPMSPPHNPLPADVPLLPTPATSPHRRPSVLGKRASEDRESAFGGSEERLRRLTSSADDLIEIDTPTSPASPVGGAPHQGDVEMRPTGRENSQSVPAADLSQLEIVSQRSEEPPVEQRQPLAPLEVDEQVFEGQDIALPASPPPPPPAPVGPPPLPPRRRSMALVAAEKFGLQQDAAEILINVLAQLEYAFDVSSDGESDQPPNLIQSLFSTKFRQQMLLDHGDGTPAQAHPPVESVFVHPIIGVEEDGKDLYDCLAELYLGGAEIEYEGKKGFKMDLIDELPPMLYIQMRRSQYDAAKRSQTKTNTHIPFERTLVMDRFLANSDPAKRERSIALTRDMMRLRARRHELKNHKPMSIPDTFRFVRDALGAEATTTALAFNADAPNGISPLTDEITPDLLEELGRLGEAADVEVGQLEERLPAAKAELEALWAGADAVEYELVSVFVHGGTGTGGHYWTYQADLPRDGNKFFYYSDETVKEVPPTDVFSDKSAQGVSPALLCYVRKDRSLVDTLHREQVGEGEGEGESATSAQGLAGVQDEAQPVQVQEAPLVEID